MSQGFIGGLQEQVRDGLRNIVGVCETCGHTKRPVQPIAGEIGISPVILAKFIRGEAGVSMQTFDALYGYVQAHKDDAPAASDEASAEAMAEA